MRKFVVHNDDGKILRVGICQNKDVKLQAQTEQEHVKIVSDLTSRLDVTHKVVQGECVKKSPQEMEAETDVEGLADQQTQKVVGVGQFRRIVDKAPEEIEADNPTPPEIPESQRPAHITNEQWQNVLSRLSKLENEAIS